MSPTSCLGARVGSVGEAASRRMSRVQSDERADGEGGADSASVGAASRSIRRNGSSGTRQGRIRPLGADATSTGDGSTSAPNATAEAPCDFRSNSACGDPVSDDGARGPNVVASLGRHRISTVNEGTARLNVFPDTAHGWADFVLPKMTLRGKAQQSNRRRRRAVRAGPRRAADDLWRTADRAASPRLSRSARPLEDRFDHVGSLRKSHR